MSLINFNMGENFPYTMVSNTFIDEYMPSANPAYTLIYLYGLKHALQGVNLEAGVIAKALNLLESDVINAWSYWNEKNVVSVTDDNGGGDIEIVFLALGNKKKESAPKKKKKRLALVQTKPNYTAQELNIYMDKSDEVRQLFSTAQKVLGKLLTANDMSTLFGFYDWLMLPMEVIEFLIDYCASNGHLSMRYIEKVAIDWSENDIITMEAAKEHIKLFNTDYRDIMKAFGISRREPVFAEQEYMKKWIFTYKMPMELLKKACEKTVMQLGKANFAYADTIINSWYLKNIKTIDDVEAQEEEFHAQNEEKKPPKAAKAQTAAKKNKFVNYEQRNWNFDELKQMEEELLDKELKG